MQDTINTLDRVGGQQDFKQINKVRAKQFAVAYNAMRSNPKYSDMTLSQLLVEMGRKNDVEDPTDIEELQRVFLAAVHFGYIQVEG